MVRLASRARPLFTSSPHPRGDGPMISSRACRRLMFSPPAWGWSAGRLGLVDGAGASTRGLQGKAASCSSSSNPSSPCNHSSMTMMDGLSSRHSRSPWARVQASTTLMETADGSAETDFRSVSPHAKSSSMWTNVVATTPTEPNLRKARKGGAIIGRRDRPRPLRPGVRKERNTTESRARLEA